MRVNIGVDVGGTKIAAGAVTPSGELLATVRHPTPAHEPHAVAAVVAQCVHELSPNYEVESIGIGAAGFIASDRSTVVFAPNLAWRNEPLGTLVSKETGFPIVVENDANAAAWGEFRFGAAAGKTSAVVVTVGTGIGGGIILGGQLLRGFQGFAGEIGHIVVNPDGEACGCGLRGCWEAHASGTALVRIARRLAATRPHRAERMLELAAGKPIEGIHVTRAAQEKDPAALECFNEIASWMGVGLADLAALLDPEIFVLAGGVSEAGDLLATPTRAAFERSLTATDFRTTPPITLATLGNTAGIIGAADLARN